MTPNCKGVSCLFVVIVIFVMLIYELECKKRFKVDKGPKKVVRTISGSVSSKENDRRQGSKNSHHEQPKMKNMKPKVDSSQSTSYPLSKQIEIDGSNHDFENLKSMPESNAADQSSSDKRDGSNDKRKKLNPKPSHDHGEHKTEERKGRAESEEKHNKGEDSNTVLSSSRRGSSEEIGESGNQKSAISSHDKINKSVKSKSGRMNKNSKGTNEASSELKSHKKSVKSESSRVNKKSKKNMEASSEIKSKKKHTTGNDKGRSSNDESSHGNYKEITKGHNDVDLRSLNPEKHSIGSLSSVSESSSGKKRTPKEESSRNSKSSGSETEHNKSDQSEMDEVVNVVDYVSDHERYEIYSENDFVTSSMSTVNQQLVTNTQSETNVSSTASTLLITTTPDNKDVKADKRSTTPGTIIRQPYKGPGKCRDRTPPCCISGQIDINLGTLNYGARVRGVLDGVNVMVSRKSQRPHIRCSNSAEIKVSFEPMGNDGCFGCTQGPFCGRRLLQLDIDLSRNRRRDTLLYITDSLSENDGASVHALFPHITIYPRNSSLNASSQVTIMGAMNAITNKVTVYIGNQFVRLMNDNIHKRLDENFCMNDLFHLNGQFDAENGGSSPNTVTIGINRRIPQKEDERSFGVCSATLKWVCPWQEV